MEARGSTAAFRLACWPRPTYGRASEVTRWRTARGGAGNRGDREQEALRRPGRPGGYRIWDNRGHRWWGDFYELCPDGLLTELNGQADQARITALMKRYRAQKR